MPQEYLPASTAGSRCVQWPCECGLHWRRTVTYAPLHACHQMGDATSMQRDCMRHDWIQRGCSTPVCRPTWVLCASCCCIQCRDCNLTDAISMLQAFEIIYLACLSLASLASQSLLGALWALPNGNKPYAWTKSLEELQFRLLLGYDPITLLFVTI